MKLSLPRQTPVLLALGLAAGTAVRAQPTPSVPTAPTPGARETVVELSTFEVSTALDRGYRAGNSVSATRIDTPIKELPFAVSAFTQQFIQDTGSTDLFDLVRYAPGVTSGGKEFTGGKSDFTIRGFDQQPQMACLLAAAGDGADIDRYRRAQGASWMSAAGTAPRAGRRPLQTRDRHDALSQLSISCMSEAENEDANEHRQSKHRLLLW